MIILFLFYYNESKKSNFKEKFYKKTTYSNISDITDVERDECIVHSIVSTDMPEKLLNKCNQQKFNKNEYTSIISRNLIHRHNEGRICLSACLLTWKQRRAILYSMLEFVSATLTEVPWVLYYGGLMGWYREKDLLPWDTDLDILVDIDKCKKLNFENDIFKISIEPSRFDPIIGRFIHKETQLYCDIFYWKNILNKTVKISCIKPKPFLYVKYNDFYPIKESFINNISIRVPSNPKVNLNIRYGKDLAAPFKKVKTSNGHKYIKK